MCTVRMFDHRVRIYEDSQNFQSIIMTIFDYQRKKRHICYTCVLSSSI